MQASCTTTTARAHAQGDVRLQRRAPRVALSNPVTRRGAGRGFAPRCSAFNEDRDAAIVAPAITVARNTKRHPLEQFRRVMVVRGRRAVRTRASSSEWYSSTDLSAPKPPTNPLAKLLVGAKLRTEADPDFLFKLCSECGIDQVITLLANVTAFGPNPLLWAPAAVASAMLLHITAILNDIVLVYALAPLPMSKKSDGDGSRAPKIAHCFQPADGVTVADRFGCWWDKFKLYAVVGAGTALLGGVLTLLIQSQPVVLDKLWRTLLLGSVHLGVSANTRYQLVNGIEVLLARLPRPVARAGTVAIRMTNNFIGARAFLALAGLSIFQM